MSLRPKTTIKYAVPTETSRKHIRRKTQDSAEEEVYDSEREHEETVYTVSREDLRKLQSSLDPTWAERQFPLDFSTCYDSPSLSGQFEIKEAIGTISAKSWDTQTESTRPHCKIRARGGGERQWYTDEVSFYREPELRVADVNVELINQVLHPCQNLTEGHFTEGQVVCRRVPVRDDEGYKMQYDPDPYVILMQMGNQQRYILIDASGRIYSELVPPEHLELVKTTWTAARLPKEWYELPEARRLIESSA